MSFLNSKKRKQKRISEVRRAAIMKRWNTENSNQEDTDALMDSDYILNDEDETLNNDENGNQNEIEKTFVRNDNDLLKTQQPASSRVTLW